jgi:hypothetical protein
VIWVAWRTMRTPLLVCTAIVALMVAWLWVGGHELHDAEAAVAPACHLSSLSAGCRRALFSANFWQHINAPLRSLLVALPAALGIILGVPLVGLDLRNSTNRVVWMQGVGRWRWLTVRLVLAVVVLVALTAVLVPVARSYSSEVPAGSLLNADIFATSGLVLVGYSCLALMLGVVLGVTARSPLWAGAAVVPLFTMARLWTENHVRVHLIGLKARVVHLSLMESASGLAPQVPLTVHSGYLPLGTTTPAPGSTWNTYSAEMTSCADHAAIIGNTTYEIPSLGPTASCARHFGLHFVALGQPTDHFWQLQIAETALFVAATMVLTVLALVVTKAWEA